MHLCFAFWFLTLARVAFSTNDLVPARADQRGDDAG